MPFTTPDYTAVRDAILRDIANQLPDAAVGSDSDYAIRANAVAAAIEGIYQHQQWIARQILPDTADADYLERWASLYGLTRKAASLASGSITFTGTPGATVPIGTEARDANDVAYLTTAAGVIGGGGTVDLAAQAVVAGTAGNADVGAALTLTSAPSGIASAAVVVSMTGGAEIESDADLLARLLARIQQPPHGGARHDYEAWALAVAGVDRAYVFPLRRGLGTVDVVPMPATGQPSAQLVSDVQDYIDDVRPVTADCLVLAPSDVQVDVTGTLSLDGTRTIVDVVAEINAAMAAYFSALAPGDAVVRTRIATIIGSVDGVTDFVLSSPAANVITTVDGSTVELATLGTVALS